MMFLTFRKTCSHCGETKESSEFHRNCRTSDGRHYWCKTCMAKAAAAWRKKQKPRTPLSRQTGKMCSQCGQYKHLGEFPPGKLAPAGRDSRCRACEGRRNRVNQRRYALGGPTIERTEKLCIDCHMMLPIEQFARNRTRPDGYQCVCRACHAVRNHDYRRRKREQAEDARLRVGA